MIDLSANGYTHEQIIDMLKSNRQVKYKYDLLDKNMLYLGQVTATGNIDFNAKTDITRIASLKINEIKDINFIDERIKPYFCLKTPKGWIDYPLGVFLISSPERYNDGIRTTRQVDCYDLSIILQEDKFDKRYCIKAGSAYTDEVLKILNGAGIVNVNMQSSDLITKSDIEFELGKSKLEAINNLLEAINYNRIYFDENGNANVTPYLLPVLRNIDDIYETDNKSIIKVGASENLDTFNVPNKIIRYTESPDMDELISVYVNNNPSSKFSTVSRGRNIVDVASINDIADQVTLDAYVQRVATEKAVYKTITFDTAVMPHHSFLDCLMINNKDLNVQGKYIELAWNMNLENGGSMRHTCRKVIAE